jgi:hypothetical protein
MLSFTVGEDDDLKHPAQKKEEQRMMIGFKFPRDLKSSPTTFQAVIRQPVMTNLIDILAQLPIGIPSMTTRSSGIAIGEI